MVVSLPFRYKDTLQRFWRLVLVKSPPVLGLHAGVKYMITTTVYSDESKAETLCVHHQLVTNNFPVNKITKKTAKEIIMADFELQ